MGTLQQNQILQKKIYWKTLQENLLFLGHIKSEI